MLLYLQYRFPKCSVRDNINVKTWKTSQFKQTYISVNICKFLVIHLQEVVWKSTSAHTIWSTFNVIVMKHTEE
jgi:hypothetical protein